MMKKTRSVVLFACVLLVAIVAFTMAAREYIAIPQVSPSAAGTNAWVTQQEVERLVPSAPEAATQFEQVRAVRQAIDRGDFVAAQQTFQTLFDQTQVGRWHFAPFSTFLDAVAAPTNDQFLQHLDQWVTAEPSSPLAYLVRARFHHQLGWQVRGNDFASEVAGTNLKRFDAEMTLAQADITKVLSLTTANPYAYYLDMLIARDDGGRDALITSFMNGIAHFPNYYPLYRVMLNSLQPKWYGSVGEMQAFVHHYTKDSMPDSPLRMLQLQLYSNLLHIASSHCRHRSDTPTAVSDCVEGAMGKIAGAGAAQQAQQVIQVFAKQNQIDATDELYDLLLSMIWVKGGDSFAAAFLQFAATSLNSDTQLETDKAGANHYIIDELAAKVWYKQGFNDNAVRLAERAIKDLANTQFPDQAAARWARANLYHDLMWINDNRGNYRQVVLYGEAAARLLGGYGASVSDDVLVCKAQALSDHYAQAQQVCGQLVASTGNMDALYWRARAHAKAGEHKQAIADYLRIAESGSWHRINAVINASVSYDSLGQYQAALNELNQYAFLFPKDKSDPEDLAIYYNNLCYNKMKLGQAQAALDDCTLSLQYGNLPDALAKQQQLIQLLRKQKTAGI